MYFLIDRAFCLHGILTSGIIGKNNLSKEICTVRINLFIAFIVSAILCSRIIDTISLVNMNRPNWLYIFPGIFLLLFIIYKKIRFFKNIIVQIFIGLITSPVYIAFLFFLLLCLIGFPPEGRFEEKNKLDIVSECDINTGNQLCKMLKEFDTKLGLEDKDFINMVVNNKEKFDIYRVGGILDKTAEERKKIAKFIESNNIVNPTIPYQKAKVFFGEVDSYDNNFWLLLTVLRLELLEVQALHAENLYSEASEEYIALWYEINNALKIKNADLVDSLVFVSILGDTGEYYYNNQSMFDHYDLSMISSIKNQIIPRLDKSFETAFSNEYNAFKIAVSNSNNTWPFIDRNKYLSELDSFYYAMAESIKTPYDESIIYQEPINYKDTPEAIFLAKNPIGELLYSINFSIFSGLITNTTKRKNEIAVYLYAIDYKNNPEDIPIDYFTGQKVKVEYFSDYIEIEVRMRFSSETQKFRIQK